MLLKGDFETFFLASILQLLCNDRKTGILRVANEKNDVKIVFEDGDIIYAVGTSRDSRLSRLLLKKELVSEAQLKGCLSHAKKKRQSLDKVLVDKGFLTSEQLQAIVNRHVEEIIFKLFLWEKGEFEYQDARINLRGALPTRLNTTKVLLEASRRIDEMSIIRKQISSDGQVFKISETIQDNEEVKLNAEEWRILSLVDGKRPVRKVIGESGYDEFVVYKVLYSLISSGLIDNAENAAAGKKDPNRKEFREHVAFYSAIVMVYLDVIHVIRKRLEGELGKNAMAVFDESKPEDLIFHRTDIFKNFDPSNPHATNIHNVLEAMKTIRDFEEGRLFLVDGFNGYLRNILDRVPEILGAATALEMAEEIEETLCHVDEYQTEAIGKTYIINDIREIVAKNRERAIRASRSGGGVGRLFSIFRRKNGFDF